jgi:hypothetical protein
MTEKDFKDLLIQKGWYYSSCDYCYYKGGLSGIDFSESFINLYYLDSEDRFKDIYSPRTDCSDEDLLFLKMSHQEKQLIPFKELLDIVVSL